MLVGAWENWMKKRRNASKARVSKIRRKGSLAREEHDGR